MKSLVLMFVFLFAALWALVGLALTGCSAEPGGTAIGSPNPVGNSVSYYTVIFDSQEATVEAVPTFVSNITVLDSLPTDPVKNGYHFAGWFTGANGAGDAVTNGRSVSADIKAYAKWNPVTYRVTFNSMGATIPATPATIMVIYPQTTVGTLPTAPVKTGYNFLGWYVDNRYRPDGFLANTPVTADITVTALWQSIPQ